MLVCRLVKGCGEHEEFSQGPSIIDPDLSPIPGRGEPDPIVIPDAHLVKGLRGLFEDPPHAALEPRPSPVW